MEELIQFVEDSNRIEGCSSLNESGSEIVYSENGNILTNSLLVAMKFGKKHKKVLESIRSTIQSARNRADGMFVESFYMDSNNRTQPMYIMNRDGFTLLTMGFTGESAMSFKLDYINAFNKMEETIKANESRSNDEVIVPKSQAEIVLMQSQLLVEQEKKIKRLEDAQANIEEKISEIIVRTNTDLQYSTIVGFAKRYGISVPLGKAATMGRVAVNLCNQYQLETGKVPDPRFGTVRTYPDSVLCDTFEKYYPNIRFR